MNRLSDFTKPAEEDSRLKRIQTALQRNGRRPDALIEILHIVQESFGFVPLWMMAYLARELKVAPSKIYGVTTFYHFFSLKPLGEHTCVICTGTACHVKGSLRVLNAVEEAFSIHAGETTPDGKVGLQTARCLGCCGLGPVAVLDNEILPKVDSAQIIRRLEEKIGGAP